MGSAPLSYEKGELLWTMLCLHTASGHWSWSTRRYSSFSPSVSRTPHETWLAIPWCVLCLHCGALHGNVWVSLDDLHPLSVVRESLPGNRSVLARVGSSVRVKGTQRLVCISSRKPSYFLSIRPKGWNCSSAVKGVPERLEISVINFILYWIWNFY